MFLMLQLLQWQLQITHRYLRRLGPRHKIVTRVSVCYECTSEATPDTKGPEWFVKLPLRLQERFTTDGHNVIMRGFPPHDRARWLVPKTLRIPLVAAAHRGAHGAHTGVSKVVGQLARQYYWPNMISCVRDFIKGCLRCQRAKAAPAIPRAARMLNRDFLWSTVACDFFGPLPRTARGNLYVLVGIDHFSRWPEAVATRTATAEVVAEFLHARIIAQHGTPRELLTDHGSHFASQVISALCQRYRIRRLMSTPYTPQSNGIVERFMGYLKNAMITLIAHHPKQWDVHLSAILFAYRAAPHPEAGDTPFYLNKGYDPVLPEMAALDVPRSSALNGGDWHAQLIKARRALEARVREQQELLEEDGSGDRINTYEVGQLVLLKRTPVDRQKDHTKITDKYGAIGRIIRILSSGTVYRVALLNSAEEVNVNRRNLRPFYKETEDGDVDTLKPTTSPILPLAQVK